MAKLYYGGGKTTIEGSGIRGIHIRYRGAIEIEDKTSDSFVINANNKGIIIYPVGEGILNELFYYIGEFKIISVITVDENNEKAPTTIQRVMDYTELLIGNTEDMTINTEDLDVTYTVGRKVGKTTIL
tara:strand:+ start:416 stop:799 length:384 start_codon:yes stop_codon:yes gene_type:complete